MDEEFDKSFTPDEGTPSPGGEMELHLDLDGFEGPIDVLLTLARDQKVDLKKISILELADQYLAFVARARHLRLEIAADYLVMAAWSRRPTASRAAPNWRPPWRSSCSGWRRCRRPGAT